MEVIWGGIVFRRKYVKWCLDLDHLSLRGLQSIHALKQFFMDADGKLNCSLDLSLKLQIVESACSCDQNLVSVEFDSLLKYILAYVIRAYSIILSCNVLFTVELVIYSYY